MDRFSKKAPKKKDRSGLYYYAQECMENKTCKSYNIREAIEAVYPAWKAMSMTERMPYETRYQNWVRSLKEEPMVLANKIQQSSANEESILDEFQLIGRYLEKFLKKFELKEEALKATPFYFIKFQSFCKVERFTDKELKYDYAPYHVLAEVGIVEYSLEKGIQNEYHAFIKPSKIPLGYRSQCMETARDVLGDMPLENFSEIKKTYAEVYYDLYQFIKPVDDENNNDPKMVFCLAKDMNETKFALRFLFDRYRFSEQEDLDTSISLIDKVYDLENLVVKLAKLKREDFGSASTIFSSYSFDYTLKTRCEWHEEKGVINCSLGIVKKYSYLISDSLCQLFNVKISTNHLPKHESVSVVVKSTDFGPRYNRFNTRSSEYSSNSRLNDSRNSNRDNDDNRPSTSYPVKRAATDSPVFASTDIRFNYETTSNLKSIVSESSIPSNIPSIYKTNQSESKSNLVEIPQSLNEANEEDGWVTRPSHRSNRSFNQDNKSVLSENSNANDNSSSLSGATKTASSFKYQGRGKLHKR